MSVLGVVLARGGSKRCKGKNLRLLGGYPLLVWTLAVASHTHELDRVVVSSEDEAILAVARQAGAMAIKRPPEMATDEASSYPPLLHAVDAQDHSFDWVCLLQPTSPFRAPCDIDTCVEAAVIGGLPAVVSVELGKLVPNGAVYVGNVAWLRETLARGDARPFDNSACGYYFMPPERSLDIDTEEDFARAEEMIQAWTE